ADLPRRDLARLIPRLRGDHGHRRTRAARDLGPFRHLRRTAQSACSRTHRHHGLSTRAVGNSSHGALEAQYWRVLTIAVSPLSATVGSWTLIRSLRHV